LNAKIKHSSLLQRGINFMR